ncbi:MAG TPA: flagellar hook-length control protein FliK [Polyangiaceae bacterium]|nr:flagellar hook-length control protein FliK [Polyangiaceae bacterium]
MSSDLHHPVGRAEPEPPSPEIEHRRRERPNSAWMLAVTQALVQRLPELPLRLSLGSGTDAPTPEASADAQPTPEAQLTEATDSGQVDGAGGAGGGANETVEVGAGSPAAPVLESRLTTEVRDDQLGRVALSVARSPQGLRIVINVADARVKALIETDQALLLQGLAECGLRVLSVQIGAETPPGTALAPEASAPERAAARPRGAGGLRSTNARVRAYTVPVEKEDDEDDTVERVDFTA